MDNRRRTMDKYMDSPWTAETAHILIHSPAEEQVIHKLHSYYDYDHINSGRIIRNKL